MPPKNRVRNESPPRKSIDTSHMKPFQRRLQEIYEFNTKQWMTLDDTNNELSSDKPTSAITQQMERWTQAEKTIKYKPLREQATYADMMIGQLCVENNAGFLKDLAEDLIPAMDGGEEWNACDVGNFACVVLQLEHHKEHEHLRQKMMALFQAGLKRMQ